MTHTGHSHPATPAARAACRKARSNAAGAARIIETIAAENSVHVLEFDPNVSVPTFVPTTKSHCELCGTLDQESLTALGGQGYTACCNEPVCYGGYTVTWTWADRANNTTGSVDACCSARVTLPHDMIQITGRVTKN